MRVARATILAFLVAVAPVRAEAPKGPTTRERVLRFPDDASVGEVRVQDADLVIPETVHDFHPGHAYAKAEYLAQAQGHVRIPPGKRVCLRIQGMGATYTRCRSALESLAPDDLYRLELASPRVTDPLMPLIARQADLHVLHLNGSRVTPRGLRRVASLSHLEELSMPEGASDGWMPEVAKLGALRVLDIGPSHITDAGLAWLGELASLESLGIYGGPKMTDGGLAGLRKLTRLRHLRLGQEGRFTDRSMAHLAAMPALKVLWLDTPNIGDEGLRHLARSKSLERLCFHWLANITNRGVAHLTNLPNLRALDISRSQVTDAGLTHLRDVQTLEVLELPSEGITDTGLNRLAELLRLRKLNVARIHYADPNANREYYTNVGLESLSRLTALESLRVGSIGITDDGLAPLMRLPRLTHLSLWGCDRITDEGLKMVRRFSQLEELYVSEAQLTIAGLEALNDLARLKVLSVKDVTQDGSGLDLSGLKNLEELTIRIRSDCDAPLTDADLACLGGLTKLRWFQIARSSRKPRGLTDRGLAHLRDLVNMERLTIGGPTLTDDGVAHLRAMKKLDMLNVYGGSFTSRGLSHLAELESLQYLTVIGDHSFSQEGIRLLFKSLPRLRRLRGGPKWPGTEILRESVLAASSRTRTPRRR